MCQPKSYSTGRHLTGTSLLCQAKYPEIAPCATRLRALTQQIIAKCDARSEEHYASIRVRVEDMPEVRDWVRTDEVRPREGKS